MKQYDITASVCVFGPDELSAEDQQLVRAAMEATRTSYAPYSHFCVGAAVRLSDGCVVTGSNQENAAFPSGLCAERTALFAANAQHPDTPVVALAIAAFTQGHFLADPIPPCGACRQVILEVEDRYRQPIRILLYGTEGIHVVDSVKALLPLYFVGASMK
ncbi:MAG: cytidine deaminase [Bacteroidaceae bacterium]|nr:cytidine deaminase [Bacteroidaceae bacterium]